MTDALLTLLRWCLLGLLYLFFLRVLQATWAGSRSSARRPASSSGQGRKKKGARATPVLVILEPASEAGREFPVNGELTIGRAASCQITLDDTYISQLHARVSAHDDGVTVEDLGSTNGTYLNRQRVTSTVIGSAGDRRQVGGVVMELR